jgi:hypothetical protein
MYIYIYTYTYTVVKAPLLDKETSLLIGSTEVRGFDAGELGAVKGFVPSDRLVMEEVWRCIQILICISIFYSSQLFDFFSLSLILIHTHM